MLLFADVESSDLIKADLPITDSAQPWPVEIAAILTDQAGTAIDFFSVHIRADGRHIRPGAEQVHGVSTRAAARYGVSEISALGMLVGFAAQANYLIGFNVEFDRDIIVAALARLGKDAKMVVRPGLQLVDLMKTSAPVCRIPSGRDDNQFRWPSLDAACEIILGEPKREGHHSAYEDVDRSRRLYLALRDSGVLEAAAWHEPFPNGLARRRINQFRRV